MSDPNYARERAQSVAREYAERQRMDARPYPDNLVPLIAVEIDTAIERGKVEHADAGHNAPNERLQSAAALADALEEAERVIAGVKAWAPQRCPCEGGLPDPCTLCGARADGVCKAGVRLPDALDAQVNDWLARAEALAQKLKETPNA